MKIVLIVLLSIIIFGAIIAGIVFLCISYFRHCTNSYSNQITKMSYKMFNTLYKTIPNHFIIETTIRTGWYDEVIPLIQITYIDKSFYTIYHNIVMSSLWSYFRLFIKHIHRVLLDKIKAKKELRKENLERQLNIVESVQRVCQKEAEKANKEVNDAINKIKELFGDDS